MELLVASALKAVGEPFTFSLTEQVPPQRFGGRLVEFDAPLSVAGRYVFDGKAFAVEGTIDTRLRSVCARCAESFTEPMTVAFSEALCQGGRLYAGFRNLSL